MINARITFTEGKKVVFETDSVPYALFYQVMRGYGELNHEQGLDRAAAGYRFWLDILSDANIYTVADWFAQLSNKDFKKFNALETNEEMYEFYWENN